ncbi:phosphatase [Leptospira perolatii]|uniref:Phosphatase n=1 Tax=Leptospira perolatii TaxID=2023191 RepID=A0A2M9ZJM0_9LEPT|nr:PP2C family protein-serine/threonine phosphatase [Leptospira perolatii]PJZ68577.1 phosphatase [Leptospira perolatii]PJZ72232.1 phosphatase [Leptospira perolatii]
MRTSFTIQQYLKGAWPIILVLNSSLFIFLILSLSFYKLLIPIPLFLLIFTAFSLFLNYVAFILYLTEKILPKEQEYGKLIKRFRKGDNRMQHYVLPLDFKDENYEVLGRSLTYNPIGGDFYNFVKDRGGNYWFGIGDTSGHGYVAGLFSMMVLNQMSHWIHMKDSPEQVIDSIIQNLETRTESFSSFPRSLYATFLLMKADSNGNFLHSGIHPSSVLYRFQKNQNEILETDGKFLSTVMNPPSKKPSPPQPFKMDKGDILFCFTDGLFEQKNRMMNKYYGENLYKFLEKTPKKNLKKLVDRLFEEIAEYAGGRIQDDMSILVIRKL